VAALSAEPETIAELEAALARYIKPRDATGYFTWFTATHHPANFRSPSDNSETGHSFSVALDAEPWMPAS